MTAQSIPIPPQPVPLREQLSLQGYRALLSDHCQLVDQVTNLAATVMVLWEAHNQLRSILDMPRLPLPFAGSLAVAARPAGPCAAPMPSAARTAEES